MGLLLILEFLNKCEGQSRANRVNDSEDEDDPDHYNSDLHVAQISPIYWQKNTDTNTAHH